MVGLVGGMLSYFSFTLQYVVRAYFAADLLLQGLITQLETDEDMDWEAFAAAVHEARQDIDDLFSVSQVGRGWSVGSGAAAGMAVCGMVMVVTCGEETGNPMFTSGCHFFFAGIVALLIILYPLACLTAKFKDSGARDNSILAAANRYPYRARGSSGSAHGKRIPESQQLAHLRLTVELASSDMGVKLLGVRVTKGLVITSFAQAAIALPSLYAFMQKKLATVLSVALELNGTADSACKPCQGAVALHCGVEPQATMPEGSKKRGAAVCGKQIHRPHHPHPEAKKVEKQK
eukprot:CAMPEP_0171228096 /NCGR_PEP_ID=MMETSP0790-20130122/38186_1 /TAXON_ID=2925 /ORGANISM="Alexandrium catenella, Strain OF101" /LENGTH=289 /DNA_ID=CAMNT_0011694229 /DNA_START=117 /DNA_END=984 /DNA_ORIENTATION=+